MNKKLTQQEICESLTEKLKTYSPEDDYEDATNLAVQCFLDKKIKAIYPLDETKTELLRQRFGINDEMKQKTLAELGQKFGYNPERIRQICYESLRLLRKRIREIKKIDNQIPIEIQKLLFINAECQSHDEYLTLNSGSDTKNSSSTIINSSLDSFQNEQIISNIKKRFYNSNEYVNIAILMLLDKRYVNVYPLDQTQTLAFREYLGINEEKTPKTNAQISKIVGNSNITTLTHEWSKLLSERSRKINELFNNYEFDFSKEVQKLIFNSTSYEKFEQNFDMLDADEQEKYFSEKKQVLNIYNKSLDLEISIENLELSARTYNAIARSGIKSVNNLISTPKESIKEIRNLGDSSYNELINKIHSLGFKFKDELEEEKDSNISVTNTDGLGTVTQRRNDLLSKGKQLTEERDTLLRQESELDSRIANAVQNKGNIQNGVQNGTTKK